MIERATIEDNAPLISNNTSCLIHEFIPTSSLQRFSYNVFCSRAQRELPCSSRWPKLSLPSGNSASSYINTGFHSSCKERKYREALQSAVAQSLYSCSQFIISVRVCFSNRQHATRSRREFLRLRPYRLCFVYLRLSSVSLHFRIAQINTQKVQKYSILKTSNKRQFIVRL